MASTSDFYRDRLAEAQKAAADATLDQVRERHLRAADAWQAILTRTEQLEGNRANRAKKIV
jgi:hypothetical protein